MIQNSFKVDTQVSIDVIKSYLARKNRKTTLYYVGFQGWHDSYDFTDDLSELLLKIMLGTFTFVAETELEHEGVLFSLAPNEGVIVKLGSLICTFTFGSLSCKTPSW